MKSRKKLTIEEIGPDDLKEITDWCDKYRGKPEFESIEKYILEGDTFHDLADVLDVYYGSTVFPIGDDERRFLFAGKDEKGSIIAWILCSLINLDTPRPEFFMQYVVVHPMFQNQGYGTEMAKELLLKPKKYIGLKPCEVFSYIEKTNIASKSLFKKFGFEFQDMTPDYVKAKTETPKLSSESTEELNVFSQ